VKVLSNRLALPFEVEIQFVELRLVVELLPVVVAEPLPRPLQ
jgi:hypothetical protein